MHFFRWPGLGDEAPDPAIRGLDDLVGMALSRLDQPCDLIAHRWRPRRAQGGLAAPDRVRRLVLTGTSGGVPVQDLGGADWRDDYRRDFPNAAAWITEVREDLSQQLHRRSRAGAPAMGRS